MPKRDAVTSCVEPKKKQAKTGGYCAERVDSVCETMEEIEVDDESVTSEMDWETTPDVSESGQEQIRNLVSDMTNVSSVRDTYVGLKITHQAYQSGNNNMVHQTLEVVFEFATRVRVSRGIGAR